MGRISVIMVLMLVAFSCVDDHEIATDLTGKQSQYPLYKTQEFNVTGTVTLLEKKDGSARLEIELKGLTGTNLLLPAHLHYGSTSKPDAELAAQLNPIDINTGKSITDIVQLVDEKVLTYNELSEFAGSIKVHLAETGEGRKIILASGNIGSLYSVQADISSIPVAECKSGK